jgi:hypothetical protein
MHKKLEQTSKEVVLTWPNVLLPGESRDNIKTPLKIFRTPSYIQTGYILNTVDQNVRYLEIDYFAI